MIVGVDPGVSGAVAVLSPGPGVELLLPLPAKPAAFLRPLADAIELVVIEQQSPMPRQGIASAGKQMLGYGVLVGICEALELPYETIQAVAWKRRLGLLARRPRLLAGDIRLRDGAHRWRRGYENWGKAERVKKMQEAAKAERAERVERLYGDSGADRMARKREILPHARAVSNFTACLPHQCSQEFEIAAADAVMLALAAVMVNPQLKSYWLSNLNVVRPLVQGS